MSIGACSATGCSNNRRFAGSLSYFHCPKDRELSKKWIVKSRKSYMINESVEKCYSNIHFCGQHFDSDMFVDVKREMPFSYITLSPETRPKLF